MSLTLHANIAPTHTYINTHMHKHKREQRYFATLAAHMHTTHKYPKIHTHKHPNTHTHKHTSTQTHAYNRERSVYSTCHLPAHNTHTHTHTYTHIHVHTHTTGSGYYVPLAVYLRDDHPESPPGTCPLYTHTRQSMYTHTRQSLYTYTRQTHKAVCLSWSYDIYIYMYIFKQIYIYI